MTNHDWKIGNIATQDF